MFHDLIHRLPSIVVYKQLREIIDLVLSIPFRKEWLPVLRDHCVAFQKSMLAYFPERTVPKVHFVTEYAQITHDYGPLRRQWCFRYEAAHSYFKKLVIRSNNFKNVPKMLATRFAFKQAYRLLRPCLPGDVCSAVAIRRLRNQSLTEQMKQLLSEQLGSVNFNQDLIECRKLFYQNIEYCRSAVHILGIADGDDRPIFGQVACIVRKKEKWWLIVDVLETVRYDEDYFAWELKSNDNIVLFDPSQMRYYHKGLDLYEVNNSTYVSFTTRLTAYH